MTRYRIKPGSLTINIPKLTVRMSAEVDSVPADPISDLPVTSTVDWASFIHRYYRITKADGRIVRAGNTIVSNDGLDVLPLSGVRNGDPGLAGREQRLQIAVGDDVTVYDQRVPVVGWSRISGTDFLKRWEQQFDTTYPQTRYPNPVPNCGTDQAVTADPVTGKARVTHTADPKFWSGSGDIEWNLPDTGATLVTGYALTDPVIEVDYDPGQYETTLVATDTGFGIPDSPLLRGFRNVYVRGPGFTPFSDLVSIMAIESDRTDRLGRSMDIVVKTDRNTDISDYLYEGASVLVTYQVQTKAAGGAWTDLPSGITTFKGFLSTFPEVGRRVGGVVTYRLQVENPLLYFKRLGIATQLLQSAASPQTWLEVYTTFANLAFVLFYVFEFNAPSMAQYVDIDFGDFEDYLFPEFSFSAGNLTSVALNAVGRRPLGNIGCLSNGRICMRDHMSILSSAQRTALGSAYTWTARQIKGEINYSRNPIPQYNRLKGSCFLIDGVTTLTHQANLLAPGYGGEDDEIPDFLAVDAAEASQIVGDMLAYKNRPTESFSIDVQGMIDVTDPALMKPHTMNTAAYDPLDCGIWENRALPLSVSRTWKLTRKAGESEVFDPSFSLNVTFEPETDGIDAPEYVDPDLGTPPVQTWCHDYDPATLHTLWTLVRGVYDTGVGFYSTGSGTDQVRLSITPGGSFTITGITFTFNSNWGGVSPRLAILDPTSPSTILASTTTAGSTSITLTYTYTGTTLMIDCDRHVGDLQAWGALRLTGVQLHGTGSSPFGADNC